MPLRPFPLALNIGTDIVHVNRIREILLKDQSTPGRLDRFLKRLFTRVERDDFLRTQERLSEDKLNVTSKHLAGRWAAKEAVIKAVPGRRLTFHDVLIRRSQGNGGVVAVILDEASRVGSRFKHDTSDSLQPLQETAHDVLRELESNIKPHPDVSENLTGRSTKDLAAEHEINQGSLDTDAVQGQVAKLSISHDGEYAVAMCIAGEGPMAGDVGGEALAREPM